MSTYSKFVLYLRVNFYGGNNKILNWVTQILPFFDRTKSYIKNQT